MKKIILMCGLLLGVCTYSFGQFNYNYSRKAEPEESKSWFDPRKITYGGGLGFAVGNNGYWGIALSPQVGYQFTNKFTLGAGMTYSHSRQSYDLWGGGKEKHIQNYVGMNLFTHYYPMDWMVLALKPEAMRVWDKVSGVSGSYEQEEFVPAVIIGAGIRFKPMYMMLNYDLVQNDRSPYGDNIFWSVGFFF